MDIRCGKHISVSPLTGKKVERSNKRPVPGHWLHCNYLLYFVNFSILAHKNKMYLLEVEESLPIMRNKPTLNKNVSFASLYLCDKSVNESSIKYVNSNFLILEPLPPVRAHTLLAYTPPPLVPLYGSYFLKKIWQRYILWITIDQRTTNNVTK